MSLKKISLAEVRKHTNKWSCWIIIHNDIYDVTKFLKEHPGGADSLLGEAGEDGTIAFEEVGHSDDARELMKKYKIGTLPAEDSFMDIEPCCPTSSMKSLSTKSMQSLSTKSSGSKKVMIQEKPWRTFDDPPRTPRSCCSRTSIKSTSSSSPKIERHVSAIVVPYGSGSNWWKYALLALAGAIIIGFIIKRQQAK